MTKLFSSLLLLRKVYQATLPIGELVAIKRSAQESMQGAVEFNTEIELLSRVHHKNPVGHVGFCFDKGEQMLMYEHVSNGTLMDNLSGTSNSFSTSFFFFF